MKRLFLISIILFLTLGLGYLVYSMWGFAGGVVEDTKRKLEWQKNNTAIYFIDLPEGLDTIDFEATIRLNSDKRIHKIKFPNGGTETNVSIYDSTYLTTIRSNSLPKIKPIIQGDFIRYQEVLFDITAFKRGKYFVHYMSCGLGSIFSLTIQ